MGEVEILDKFKTQLLNFLDELIEIIPDDGDLLTFRIFVNDQLPTLDLMRSFITHGYPYKERAKKREDSYLITKVLFLDKLDSKMVDKFKGYWRSKIFTADDRKVIWDWVDLFFKIGDEWVKLKGEPAPGN